MDIRTVSNRELILTHQEAYSELCDAQVDLDLHLAEQPSSLKSAVPSKLTFNEEVETTLWQETFETLQDFYTIAKLFHDKVEREMRRRDNLYKTEHWLRNHPEAAHNVFIFEPVLQKSLTAHTKVRA